MEFHFIKGRNDFSHQISRRYTALISTIAALSIVVNFYLFFTDRHTDFEEDQLAYLDSIMQEQHRRDVARRSAADDNKAVFTIGRGDTLNQIFAEAGLEAEDVQQILIALGKYRTASRLQIGDEITIKYQPTSLDSSIETPRAEEVRINKEEEELIISYNSRDKKYHVKLNKIPIEKHRVIVGGQVDGSIYSSISEAGASASTIMQFIRLFSHSIDFQRDVRAGDVFEIFYEYYTNPKGEKVKEGDILYAKLQSRGKGMEIYRYEGAGGKIDYYDSKGASIRKALLRTPINGAKISSGYGPRHHPILDYTRMHRGVDYGASRGTPILAAGDGVVVKVAVQPSGYGKHVKIKHNDQYSTLYAHMHRFAKNVAPGTRVKQGDVIGYVGSTGLASGPHLHYELIRKEGGTERQVNPAKVSFNTSQSLRGNDLRKFIEQRNTLVQQVATHRLNNTQVARNGTVSN
jgi:murein DD-endopeptidase MepM/ murein hydrolase activator NlpD